MRKIYFNNNVINFVPESEMVGDFRITPNTPLDTTKVLQKLEFNKDLTINGDDIDVIYREFCSFFKLVDAGGGVVKGLQDRWLMIKRNGRWDLPKGHREVGEDIEPCAIREVEEECGVADLKIVKHLITTKHIYKLDGVWILKSTYWYLMESTNTNHLTPQTEEGITEVRWVEQSDVAHLLKNSFSTIKEVFGSLSLEV